MTLNTDGFLSPTVDVLARDALNDLPRHKAFVEEVNRFAVAVLMQPRDIFRRDADLFAVVLLGRAVQDFQAATILAMRGMRAQSRSMVRSAFETSLYCAAASRNLQLAEGVRDKRAPVSFIDAFEGGHQRFRSQVAAELRELPQLPPEQASALEALIDEIGTPGKHQDIDVRGLANDLGLSDLYTIVYRPLSQDAHPTATSLQHHLNVSASGKIEGLHIGPDYTQCGDTLALAVCSLLVALDAFVDRFGTAEEAAAVKGLVKGYRELHNG